jgi:hypothetical protein
MSIEGDPAMPAPGTRRTVVAVAAAELVPVPLLDTWLQNRARRWYVRALADERQLHVDEDVVRALADAPFAPGRRVLLWPVKTLLKKVFFGFGLVTAAKEAHEVLDLEDRLHALLDGDQSARTAT